MIFAGFQGPLLNSAPLRTFLFIPLMGTTEAALHSLTSPYVTLPKPPISADSKMKCYFHTEGISFIVCKVYDINLTLISF